MRVSSPSMLSSSSSPLMSGRHFGTQFLVLACTGRSFVRGARPQAPRSLEHAVRATRCTAQAIAAAVLFKLASVQLQYYYR